ncbi:hypothetical protein [Bifidobacterium vansinderenii]|uniref:hypothetical protein n=1 Tax=Bifidobacterium vansinderenii TaxID=1984871 RepID=UPI002FCE100A
MIFQWDSGLADHSGFVEINRGSYVRTIEGNADNGMVARCARSWGTSPRSCTPPARAPGPAALRVRGRRLPARPPHAGGPRIRRRLLGQNRRARRPQVHRCSAPPPRRRRPEHEALDQLGIRTRPSVLNPTQPRKILEERRTPDG